MKFVYFRDRRGNEFWLNPNLVKAVSLMKNHSDSEEGFCTILMNDSWYIEVTLPFQTILDRLSGKA